MIGHIRRHRRRNPQALMDTTEVVPHEVDGNGVSMAAMRENFNAVLVEREAEYVADIRRRIAHVHGADLPLFA